MLAMTANLAPAVLAGLLGPTGAVKLLGSRVAAAAPKTALARLLRDSGRAALVLRALGAGELALATALLLLPGTGLPGAWAPGTAAVALGVGFVGYLGYGRATAPVILRLLGERGHPDHLAGLRARRSGAPPRAAASRPPAPGGRPRPTGRGPRSPSRRARRWCWPRSPRTSTAGGCCRCAGCGCAPSGIRWPVRRPAAAGLRRRERRTAGALAGLAGTRARGAVGAAGPLGRGRLADPAVLRVYEDGPGARPSPWSSPSTPAPAWTHRVTRSSGWA
ncbi:hypothetical protein NKH77_54500 [Streptomyces sp. M19]